MTMVSDRSGDWMQTYTGRPFYPLDPRPEDIYIEDIAHALGMSCRYGGHVDRFYSVAEHCVLMSQVVSPKAALCALLHDAAEAYLSDVVRPIKKQLPDYVTVENRLLNVIFERFGVDPVWPVEVVNADSRILHDERAALLKPSPQPWAGYIEAMTPLDVKIECWSPEQAADMYLLAFQELT